jgi:hypothetical protein
MTDTPQAEALALVNANEAHGVVICPPGYFNDWFELLHSSGVDRRAVYLARNPHSGVPQGHRWYVLTHEGIAANSGLYRALAARRYDLLILDRSLPLPDLMARAKRTVFIPEIWGFGPNVQMAELKLKKM